MFNEGDSVRFIICDVLGGFSGRKATIVRRVDDDEVETPNGESVYEVYVPLYGGNVQVLSGFIKNINEWF